MKVVFQLKGFIPTSFLLRLLKNQSLQSKEKKLVIKSEGTMKSHTWVVWMQSHIFILLIMQKYTPPVSNYMFV